MMGIFRADCKHIFGNTRSINEGVDTASGFSHGQQLDWRSLAQAHHNNASLYIKWH